MSSPYGPSGYGEYDRDDMGATPPYQNPFDQTGQQQPGYQQPYPAQPNYQPHPQSGFQPQHQQQYGYQPQPEGKSWVATLLLCFFLGTLGVHNFYLGYRNRGLTQLALIIIGWLTTIFLIGFVLIAIVYIWVIVEFIQILLRSGAMRVDAKGIPLK